MKFARAATSLFLTATLSAAEPDGAVLFEQTCIPCHGPDGRPRTPAARKLGAKDLTESRISDEEITRQITNGSKDAKGKEKMPPFREQFNGAQIAALVAFVKSLRK